MFEDATIEQKLELYALNQQRIKSIQEEQDALKEEILPAVSDNPKLGETSLGKFTVSNRKSYKYPKHIEELEEDLKAKKAKAVSAQEVEVTETPSLRFTPIKL